VRGRAGGAGQEPHRGSPSVTPTCFLFPSGQP
jgi:hypothetical protein